VIDIAPTPPCQHTETKKHGRDPSGNQRMRCKACGATWIIKPRRPLGDMRVDHDKATFALKMILEGTSIRSTERLTGFHRDTLCDLVATTGANCESYLRRTNAGLTVKDVECDELWAFIGMKEKTRDRLGYGQLFGDCYTYVAMERTSKFVITWLNGKRTSENTWEFVNDLYFATTGRYQVSTDGYGPYQAAFPLVYQFNVDFAQLIKRFGGTSDVDGSRRYSPANLVSKDTTIGCGQPDEDRICTSHSERLNLSLRMQMRRFTRLTNGHSKCWENHAAMIGLYFGWYNYCRVHSTIKTTPAVAQGVADKPWSIEELLTAAA